jgi:hypothetical protein
LSSKVNTDSLQKGEEALGFYHLLECRQMALDLSVLETEEEHIDLGKKSLDH